ncbi:hypothetical protein ACSS6W_003946 [Trichoderma asperelloides]
MTTREAFEASRSSTNTCAGTSNAIPSQIQPLDYLLFLLHTVALRSPARACQSCSVSLEAVREVPHAGAKQAGLASAPSSGTIHTVRSGKRPALWHGLIKPTPLIIALAQLRLINFSYTEFISVLGLTYKRIVRRQSPTSLENKLSSVHAILRCQSYSSIPMEAQSFLDDFLELTGLHQNVDNVSGVLFYLRVLSSVHDEIADMLLSRQSGDSKRNTELKDQLRAQDMQKVAESWKQLLSRYSGNDVVIDLVLKVIGKWVSWMDISLVVSQDMLNLLLPVVGRTGSEDKVRDTAIDTLTEICGKKMRSTDKMDMISFLNLQDIVSQLVASPMLNDLKGTPQYDTDLAEAIAKLVNTTVADIIRALDDSQASDDTRTRAKQHLDGFLPLLLRFFSDEYDEVCSTVIPSLTDLLTFLRKLGQLNQDYSNMLSPILNAIVQKMRYDETTSWGNEDEQTDEAEFQELRRRLQYLQKTIAAIDQNLYMDVLSNLVATTFQTLDQQGSHMDWRDLDLALHEMYLFGELALPNQGLGTKNQPSTEASERLVVMMQKMVESVDVGIANFSHPAIVLQYMEICVRYCVVFETHSQYIPQVLENFVRLVHHNHVRIKTRSWYLFHRFIKHLRSRVGNVAETVIQSIGDLLPIKAEVPGEDADDDMSSDESDHSADALFTSQLYLFEAIGCISSTHSTPAENQALYARSVMDPLFQDMEVHLPRAKGGDAQANLQIHHIVMALGTLAHGFSDWTPGSTAANQHGPPDKLVSDEFSRAAEAILIALRELNSSAEIRTACRSAFSKLLGVLGAAVLPQLPKWIEGLLSQSSSKDEMAMFLRLLDQVVFGFKTEIYDVLNMLLTPLLQRIFGGLGEPISGTDDEIQLAELRREYLSFIQIILNNGLEGVLISEANQGFFEPMIASVLELAKTLDGNLGPSRLAFTIMARISALWGGPDNEVFPSLGINSDDFLRSLTTSTDKRQFSNYLQQLLSNRSGISKELCYSPQSKAPRLPLLDLTSLASIEHATAKKIPASLAQVLLAPSTATQYGPVHHDLLDECGLRTLLPRWISAFEAKTARDGG